jgi:hypothetical protein
VNLTIVAEGGKSSLTLGSDFESSLKKTRKLLERARERVRGLEESNERISEIAEVLKDIPESWRRRDPGKNGTVYWFVDSGGERAVVKELLSEDVAIFQGDGTEWSQHLEELDYRRLDTVPSYSAVVEFASLATKPCLICGEMQPVIESYQQRSE